VETYTTLDGDVVDISELTLAERAFFDRCYAAFQERVDWGDFLNLVHGADNPALEPGKRVTKAAAAKPLYRATRDLEDRDGILTGRLAHEDGAGVDPLEDSFVSVPQAARLRGVTTRAVYLAIERGDLVASKGRPVQISRRTLDRWVINETRQNARRGASAANGEAAG
jgi:hypothetical protein